MAASDLEKQGFEKLGAVFFVPDVDLLSAVGNEAVQCWVPDHVFYVKHMLGILLNN